MRWLVTNWRLKLLAIGLALALLMTVAFSENPPTSRTVKVGLTYENVPSQLVVLNPPSSVPVSVVGLASNVHQFSQTQVGASVDLSGAHAGSNQPFVAHVNAAADGVSINQTQISIPLDLEKMGQATMPIQVRVSNVNSSAGLSVVTSQTYATCGSDTVQCKVTVHAPQNLLRGLTAYLNYDFPIQSAGLERAPGLPILFERKGKQLDLAHTNVFPNSIQIEPNVATARVQTQGGVLTKTVGITVQTSGQLACGYQIGSVTILPDQAVTISGPTDAVAKVQSLPVGTVDVSGLSANQTYSRQVQVPSGVQLTDPTSQNVTVAITVSRAFSCTAPTPSGGGGGGTSTPTPTPLPSATVTPTP
ncbi:MAG: CdaR family protein [Candidatus Dormiibacterota bacterium]